jgi:hypothetical protein
MHMGRPPSLKEATRRRAQGATLQELAESYDRSISTMLAADEARMSGIERVRIHTHLGVPNTDKTGRRMIGTPRLLNEVHIPFAIDRDEVS